MAVAPAPATAAGRGFAIANFVTSVQVKPDASLVVREDVTFEFQGTHAGVYRTIPVRYERAGLEFALRLDGVGAYDEAGRPLEKEITYSGRYVRIKAWVPGATDTKKVVTFVYRVRRGLLRFDDHDELYWNATGDEWEVPIQHAEVYVNTPAGVSDKDVRATAYTGPRGSAAQDFRRDRVGGYLRITATRPLRPREGMTVVVGWPPGHIGRPSALAEASWFVGDNWPLALPLAAFGLGCLFWWAYGRDPGARRSVKPEYEPPSGLIPAQGGALVDEKAEPREVLATIVDLAVRGYLHIEQITTAFGTPDFMFKRLRPIGGDPNLTDFELFVLAKLFSADWTLNMRLLSEVRRDYDNVFPPIRDRLYRLMVEDGLFPRSPARMRRDWMIPGVLLLVGAVVLPRYWPSRFDVYGLALPLGIGASGLVLLGWSRAMAYRTRRGVHVLARMRGFQEFLERAEKDRLERMPADTLHRFLPWAISLGVTERWIFGFDGLKVDVPSWFTSSEPFSLHTYHTGLTRFGRDTTEAILTSRTGGFAAGRSGFGSSGGGSGGAGRGAGGGGGGTF